MNRAARVEELFSKLKFNINPDPRRLRNQDGPVGRVRKLQKTITALIKYERLELNYHRADEARGYVELLLSQAIRYGPSHKETLELADYWILDKALIPKIFNVLVPRYQNYPLAFTNLHRVPLEYVINRHPYPRGVLELTGNPYPELGNITLQKSNMLHNQLLDVAQELLQEDKHSSKKTMEELNRVDD